jgi:hypothetical protein
MVKPSAAVKPTSQTLLTPPPRELTSALRQAAREAQRLAKAYGAKVPAARTKKA